jgi:hypothetical protein
MTSKSPKSPKNAQAVQITAGDTLDAALLLAQGVTEVGPEPFRSAFASIFVLVASVRDTIKQVKPALSLLGCR